MGYRAGRGGGKADQVSQEIRRPNRTAVWSLFDVAVKFSGLLQWNSSMKETSLVCPKIEQVLTINPEWTGLHCTVQQPVFTQLIFMLYLAYCCITDFCLDWALHHCSQITSTLLVINLPIRTTSPPAPQQSDSLAWHWVHIYRDYLVWSVSQKIPCPSLNFHLNQKVNNILACRIPEDEETEVICACIISVYKARPV